MVERSDVHRTGRSANMLPTVYILKCSNNRYYVGSTNNLKRRFEEHSGGKVRATRNLRPIVLAFSQNCSTLSRARKMERKLKSYKSRKIIEMIIRDGLIRDA